jgi:hypothetical protein
VVNLVEEEDCLEKVQSPEEVGYQLGEDYQGEAKAERDLVAYLLLCLVFVYHHYKLQLN